MTVALLGNNIYDCSFVRTDYNTQRMNTNINYTGKFVEQRIQK
jgi:hypothetical protein